MPSETHTAAKSPAHQTLVQEAQKHKRCLILLLEEGSRDFEVMREFLERHISHQHAADLITRQVSE